MTPVLHAQPSLPVPARIESTPIPALAGLCLATLLSSLGTSIANVALPELAREFSVPFQAVQWVVLAYLLAVTALIVGAGRLGDGSGQRRLLLAGIVVFTAASVLCGLAPTLSLLVLARAVQGLGAAAMMALSLSMVSAIVPKDRMGRAMGLLGTMSAVGTALGPSIGGALLAGPGWRFVFLAPVPLGLAALYLVQRHLPPDQSQHADGGDKPDPAGTLLLVLALAAYALAMTLGRGAFGPLNVLLLALAALAGTALVAVERRAESPVIRVELFRDRALRASLSATALVSAVLMATLVVGPFHLSRALGLEPAHVGLAMMVGPLVAALAGVPSGRLVDRWGAPRATRIGLAAAGGGSLALALMPVAWGVAGYSAAIVLLTGGYALFQSANNTQVMAGAPAAQRGTRSGLLNLARNLGLITGASAMGAVFILACGSPDIDRATPAAVASGTAATFALGAALAGVALALSRRSRPRE